MKRFRKPSPSAQLTRDEALGCTPVKSRHVEAKRLPTGDYLIQYPEPPSTSAISGWIQKLGGAGSRRVRVKKIQLDGLGSEVWELIDNHRTVSAIIQCFASHHQLPIREAEVSIVQFVRILGRKGLIGLKIP
jgi:hypothetical protein